MAQMKTAFFRRILAALVLLVGIAVFQPTPVFADDAAEAKKLVTQSQLTFESFAGAKEMGAFRNLLKQAKGVFISPQVLEGAFVFGVSGGSGVFVAHDAKGGTWNGPAFYTIGEVSFGLQAGGQSSQVIMLIMTDRGVNALLSPSVKLGADVGVAAGPVGVGAAAATANISADILVFSLSKGLYGGIALTGAVVAVRNSWNNAYYDKQQVKPRDILISGDVSNSDAASLLRDIAEAASSR